MNEINVCNACEHPVIGTWAFAGAEVYCPTCGATGDMFYGREVPATTNLTAERKMLRRWWNGIVKDLLHQGAQHTDCDLCKTSGDRYHVEHATKAEFAAHERANRLLKARVKRYEATEGAPA